MNKFYIKLENRTYTFTSIQQMFIVCQLGGYTGQWEDFTGSSLKELQPYMILGYNRSSIHH